MALVSCTTYTDAGPRISQAERHVLVTDYYWRPDAPPRAYTEAQLDALLRASADPTLDGEDAEAQTSRVVLALASVGDEAFAQSVANQPESVRRVIARDVAPLWRRYGLHYPRTQSVLQPYT